MHVVLVDDDASLLSLMEGWMTRAGHQVTSFDRFDTAKNYLASTTPDALITDVRLGAFNGLQLVVLAKVDHPELIAIVLTGYDDQVLHEEAIAAGAHYLVKPVGAEPLLACLKPRRTS